MTRADHIYAPVVVQCTNDLTGELLGAALTCRAMKVTTGMQLPGGDAFGLNDVADAHSELDLMAVRSDRRGTGIGTRLLTHAGQLLRERDVQVWFGNITADLDVDRAAAFYRRCGFTIGRQGARLPRLLDRDWVVPGAEVPEVYFWRYLR